MTETAKPNGRPKGFKMSDATKAKLRKAMKKRWRRARKEGTTVMAKKAVNGHRSDPNTGRKTARAELIDLAKIGRTDSPDGTRPRS